MWLTIKSTHIGGAANIGKHFCEIKKMFYNGILLGILTGIYNCALCFVL